MKVTQGMALEKFCQLAQVRKTQADTRSRLDRARPAAAHDWCFLFMGAGVQEGGGMGCQVRPASSVHTREAEQRPKVITLQKIAIRQVMDHPARIDQSADPTIMMSAEGTRTRAIIRSRHDRAGPAAAQD